MGCFSSSEMDDDPHAIPYQMKYTYLYDSIRFWNQCEDLLSTAEDLRSGLEDNKDDMLDIADCDKLNDGTLLDAIQGWLWCLSSVKEGSIVECDLTLTNNSPYFHIYNWDYNHDVRKFNKCFEDYVNTCFEGPDKVQEMVDSAQDLVGKAEELQANIKSEAENANLNPLEIARLISHTAQNIVTLKDGITRMQRLKGVIQDALKDLQEIIPKFPSMVNEADQVGKKCHKEGLTKPDDCLLKFIDKTRLMSDEKLKQMKEEKKRKKKEQKEKKKQKKDAWRKAREELLK